MEPTNSQPVAWLDVADAARSARWALRLEGIGFRCLQDPAEASSVLLLDLVLADHPLPAPPESPPEAAFGMPADHGVIIVGHDVPADLCLPLESTDREIELACRLLVEVVRLRRERRHETQTRNTLLRLALTDPLTGLGNRRAWQEALRMRWAAVRGTRTALCLAIVDFDYFKRLNDQYGHAAGDRALEIAGEVLSAEVRRDDFVARLGGDEFGLLLVGMEPDTIFSVVERVRARLSARLSAETETPLTVSAGFAIAADPDLPASDALLMAADQALQAAKRLGRERTVSASSLSADTASAGTPENSLSLLPAGSHLEAAMPARNSARRGIGCETAGNA